MNLVQKISVSVVGLAALISALGCSPSLTVQPRATNQEYIQVAEKIGKEGEKLPGGFSSREGIRYFHIEFFLDGIKGNMLTRPEFGQVVFNATQGTSESVPYLAITRCDGSVINVQESPEGRFIGTGRNSEVARKIENYIKGLYSRVGINPTNCEVTATK